MSFGPVAVHIATLVADQVPERGAVAWYDPNGVYTSVVKALMGDFSLMPDSTRVTS